MPWFHTAGRIAALPLVVMLCFTAPARAAPGDWDWMVAPYGWAPDIGTDLETQSPPSSASTDTDFGDIIDKVDGAFQLHIEGQQDRWGMFADFTYLGLADDNARPRFRTEADLDTRLFELAAVWSPGAERFQGVDVFAGLRYIDVDLAVQLEPADPAFPVVTVDGGESFSDFMLGARYTWTFAERWGVTLRGDASFGDTEGTWNASAVGQYRAGSGTWLFGYRHLDIEIGTGRSITHLTLSGPLIGYGFRF